MSDIAPIVAITGIGAVTAAGATRDETWRRVVSGETAISPGLPFDAAPYSCHVAAIARDFDPIAHFGERRARQLDRCQQLSLVAAHEAMADAGITPGSFDLERAAIVIGTSLAGMIGGQEYERRRIRTGQKQARYLSDLLPHACLERLTAALGFRGPRMVFSTACTSSTLALSYAMELLRTGRVDIVLSGGVDPLAELSFAGFSSMGNVASGPCSPFSEPIGLTLGEGAAMLLLEREDSARARGASVRARLLGWGLSTDAYHATSGDPSGRPQARAAHDALTMAGLNPEDLDYINAHGTGTAGNDPVETRAIHLLLGKDAPRVPVSSLKGTLGHTLGAAGSVETAITALATQHHVIPPTANFTQARSGCDLDYVPMPARKTMIKHALSWNFAFGGNNAALVVGTPDGIPPVRPLGKRRVVVTGLGMVSPIGSGVDAFRRALETGHTGVAPITRFETDGSVSRLAAVVEDFAPSKLTRADLRRADRISSLIVSATDLTMRDAALRVTAESQDRIGIVVGTTNGPLTSCRKFFEPVAARSSSRVNPSIFPSTVCNAGIALAATHLRIKGPNVSLCCGQSAGLAALCVAYDLIHSGAADAIMAGGADELEACIFEGYSIAHRIAPYARRGGEEICAPFDHRRSGLVLGEGGAFLMLESLESAIARKARIYAEVLGWAGNADRPIQRGWDVSGEGMAHCMTMALADAQLEPTAIDCVGAAAMSHPLQDRAEAQALQQVFSARRVPVMAFSSRVGVSAATAPLSAAAIIIGMAEGFLPGSMACRYPDPECDVDAVDGPARAGNIQAALVNATSLGGSNYSLVLHRWTV